MAPLLIALGSCHEALVQQPLLAALRAARLPHTVAWFGTAEALVEARSLGLPEDLVVPAAPASERPEQRLARLAGFAAELLAGSWSLMLLAGHGTFAPMLAAMARSARVPVLRLGAGVRTHRGPGDAPRRAADHAADAWCTANEERRQQLLREGARADAVFVVGEPLGEALANLPAAPATASSVVLAFEHMQSLQPPEAAAAMLDALTAARGSVPLLVVPTLPVFADPKVRLPVGCRRLEGGAAAQLHTALGARVVVTDSAGWQDLCVQAGVPCLVPAAAGALPELLGAGAVATFGTEPGQLQAALQRLAGAPRQPAPIAAAAAATLAAIDKLRQPATATTAPAAPTPPTALPSDGDASGRTLGEDEIALVSMAIRRGTLNSTRGTFVTTFEQRFAKWLGRKHAIACGSGSAAVHVALACLQLQPGDEVITTPITDMGALTPILYEGAVPVFADVDPRTLNVTAATIEAQLTDRTRAIVVTHLFGLPCELAAILELAEQRGVPVIEDSAQAFGATYHGRRIGTFGRLAAFSLQQGKHITTGEGGIVATDDDALARRAFLYVNKAWGYGDPKPDHYFPALNYRLTELQGAVAVAQLPKLDGVVGARRAVAAALQRELAGVAGLVLPQDPEHGTHSWWKFAFRVDPAQIPGGAVALGKRMQQAGIACVPRYVQKPAFECELFRDWSKSPVTWLPLQHNPRRERPQPLYHRGDYPGACEGLEHVVVLPINERYTDAHVRTVATAIAAAAAELRRG